MPLDPPVGFCTYEWDGIGWQMIFEACATGKNCVPPTTNGTEIGERVSTNCA